MGIKLNYWQEAPSSADFRQPYFKNKNGDVLYFNNLSGWCWKVIYGDPGKMIINRELHKDQVEQAKQWGFQIIEQV